MNNKPEILYVDDEKDNLDSFESAFRRQYKVYRALTAQEGIQILKQHSIKVIITDQRMPRMTGVQFLESIIPEFPEPIRMILTAFTDQQSIIDAINRGQIYQFITKPWTKEHLQVHIQNAIETFDLKTKNRSLMNELQKNNKLLEQKVKERTQKLEESNEALRNRNLMISLLLREMHHRVVNKLLGLRALVREYARQSSPLSIKEILKEIESRIVGLAKIHQQLHYVDQGNIQIHLQKYFEDIGKLLYPLYANKVPNFKLEVKAANHNLAQPFAYFLGFVIYELLSNSFKYAFVEHSSATVMIDVKFTKEGLYQLNYQDNGKGLPENIYQKTYFQTQPGDNLGLHIVYLICKIHQGTFQAIPPTFNQTGALFQCNFKF